MNSFDDYRRARLSEIPQEIAPLPSGALRAALASLYRGYALYRKLPGVEISYDARGRATRFDLSDPKGMPDL